MPQNERSGLRPVGRPQDRNTDIIHTHEAGHRKRWTASETGMSDPKAAYASILCECRAAWRNRPLRTEVDLLDHPALAGLPELAPPTKAGTLLLTGGPDPGRFLGGRFDLSGLGLERLGIEACGFRSRHSRCLCGVNGFGVQASGGLRRSRRKAGRPDRKYDERAETMTRKFRHGRRSQVDGVTMIPCRWDGCLFNHLRL